MNSKYLTKKKISQIVCYSCVSLIMCAAVSG